MYCKRIKDKFEKNVLNVFYYATLTKNSQVQNCTVVSACLMTLKFNAEIPTEVGVLGSSSSRRIFFI